MQLCFPPYQTMMWNSLGEGAYSNNFHFYQLMSVVRSHIFICTVPLHIIRLVTNIVTTSAKIFCVVYVLIQFENTSKNETEIFPSVYKLQSVGQRHGCTVLNYGYLHTTPAETNH